jgi:hypothetical protein
MLKSSVYADVGILHIDGVCIVVVGVLDGCCRMRLSTFHLVTHWGYGSGDMEFDLVSRCPSIVFFYLFIPPFSHFELLDLFYWLSTFPLHNFREH